MVKLAMPVCCSPGSVYLDEGVHCVVQLHENQDVCREAAPSVVGHRIDCQPRQGIVGFQHIPETEPVTC